MGKPSWRALQKETQFLAQETWLFEKSSNVRKVYQRTFWKMPRSLFGSKSPKNEINHSTWGLGASITKTSWLAGKFCQEHTISKTLNFPAKKFIWSKNFSAKQHKGKISWVINGWSHSDWQKDKVPVNWEAYVGERKGKQM